MELIIDITLIILIILALTIEITIGADVAINILWIYVMINAIGGRWR